jgi:hypothetical protein
LKDKKMTARGFDHFLACPCQRNGVPTNERVMLHCDKIQKTAYGAHPLCQVLAATGLTQ